MHRRFFWLLLLLLMFSETRPVQAESFRMVPDLSTNHYDALEEFLKEEGYWPEEVQAVLDPLEGQLDQKHFTHRVVPIQSMDDIPGLRPFPDGVVSFVHRRQNVFYVGIAEDHLLVGISKQVTRENGRTVDSKYNFEKFDLISGLTDNALLNTAGSSLAMKFVSAHGTYFGAVSGLGLSGFFLLWFLAAAVRRQPGAGPDPLIQRHRRNAGLMVFKFAAITWILALAGLYGFIHFVAHTQYLNAAMFDDNITYSLAQRMIIQPDRLRLISFGLTETAALFSVILLGWWAGMFSPGQKINPSGPQI